MKAGGCLRVGRGAHGIFLSADNAGVRKVGRVSDVVNGEGGG